MSLEKVQGSQSPPFPGPQVFLGQLWASWDQSVPNRQRVGQEVTRLLPREESSLLPEARKDRPTCTRRHWASQMPIFDSEATVRYKDSQACEGKGTGEDKAGGPEKRPCDVIAT